MLKILFYFTGMVLVIGLIFFLSWNYIFVYLPIKGVVINPISFTLATNLAFAFVITGVLIAKLVISYFK